MENKRYNGLDGVRALSAIGVAMMHIMLCGEYNLGFIGDKFIANLGELVYLFMIISAFSLCCGYYEKIMGKKITPTEFYGKRIKKILPFFALLSVLDFVSSPGKTAAMELFANLTLCFGFLPNANISLIGVGWFIGLVFVFYITFPFYCMLIENKRRAWLSFALSIVFNLLCSYYFFDSAHMPTFDYRSNIVYAAPYFFAGGLIYLYRDTLSGLLNRFKYVVLLLVIGSVVLMYVCGISLWTLLLAFSLIVIYALREKSPLLENKITSFLGGLSMEIYLSHMIFFRILQKIKLTNLFSNDILSYILTVIITLVLVVAFAYSFNKIFSIIKSKKLCQKN